MANQVKGHLAHASNYSRAKRDLETAEGKKADLMREIERAKTLPAALAAIEAELAAAERAFEVEKDRVNGEIAEQKLREWLAAARKMDVDGMTPDLLNTWQKLAAELHSNYRRVSASYEVRKLCVGRLLGTEKGHRPLAFKTFETLSQSWLRQPVEGRAA